MTVFLLLFAVTVCTLLLIIEYQLKNIIKIFDSSIYTGRIDIVLTAQYGKRGNQAIALNLIIV